MLPDSSVGIEEDPRPAGAPATEIVIMPEMIDAGVLKLFDYDPDFANERDIVAEIFIAMLNAHSSCRENL